MRRAAAYRERKCYKEAKSDIEEALKLFPHNQELLKL